MKTKLALCAMTVFAFSVFADDFTTDFEAGFLRGWTRTGTAFDSQPTLKDNPTARGRDQPSNHQGNWWIGTYENYQGKPGQNPGDVQDDGPIGTLTSPAFLILGEEINFLVGGGNHNENDPAGATMVVVQVEGGNTWSFTGNNNETMTRVSLPVGAYKGMMAVLKIIDNNTGAWGHINCDDFQMLDENGDRLPFAAIQSRPAPPHLSVCAAPSGPEWSTLLTEFVTIEDRSNPPIRNPRASMSTGITTDDHADLKITFSGEVWASAGANVFVRALVDNQPAAPSDVVFAIGSFTGTRSFTFIQENVAAGGHWIEIQWCVGAGATAYIGDATLSFYSASRWDPSARLMVRAAPSGPLINHIGNWWESLPELSGSITTPVHGNLAITFSGEAFGEGGARVFLQALVDGQPAQPSDVLLACNYYGASSFTFVKQNVPAGVHNIVIRWMTDGGRTAHLGDRTMAVVAAPEPSKHGGLTVNAPAQGADVKTTSTSWVDIPGLVSDIATAANSHLEIGFTAETTLFNSPQGMWVRALVDEQPAEPSDVIVNSFKEDAFSTRAFTFTKRSLGAGLHTVRLQWRTTAGGNPALGDRTMALHYWRAEVPDLGTTWSNLKPVLGTRKILAILWDPHRPEHPAPAKNIVENLLFGSNSSVVGYFLENSGGRFQLENAGVLGWYDALLPASYYWGPEDPGDTNTNGWIHPHVQKWAEAIRAADSQFNFAACDTDLDGYLSPDELSILMIIPQKDSFGTMNYPVGREVPREPLIVDGVRIDVISEAYLGSPPSLGILAHELAHLMFNAGDMYFYFFQPYAAGPYSLMDQSLTHPGHLDPVHKLRLGWLTPRIITSSGWHQLRDIETSQEVLLLNDPEHGSDEYFLVENRWRGNSYDTALPYSGLAVWQIIEDPAVYSSLPVPPSVDPAQWTDPKWTGWARRAIRMIRPIYGPPYNTALWDESNATTGYDLLSSDRDPSHVTLRWADGTPSGFSLLCMPIPGPDVKVGVLHGDDNLVGPPLTVQYMRGNLIFSWSAVYACFQLEVADRIAPQPNWSPVGVAPQLERDNYYVTIQAPRLNRFFRLHKP